MTYFKKLQLPYFLVIASILCFSYGCKTNSNATLEGVWESIGYGRLLKIENNQFILADVTEISCNPILSGHLEDFLENIGIEKDTLWVKNGINKYLFKRTEKVPSTCEDANSEETNADPMHNFEVLAATFKEHYAYFEDRGIDWDSTYEHYKSKINPQTSEGEFYYLMDDMLSAFNDGHTSISAPDSIEEAAKAYQNKENISNENTLRRYGRREVAKAVAQKYIPASKSYRSGSLRWGILPSNIGYIQLNQMLFFADYGIPDSLAIRDFWMKYMEIGESKSLWQHTLDENNGWKPFGDKIMEEMKNTDAIIIDVRFNGGGKDEIGLDLLSRFNKTDQIIFTKKAKAGKDETPANEYTLKACSSPYTKPLYILTSDGSASASDIFALASLSIPHSIRIGGHTNGIFSDILEKSLPNGWEIGLSNEVYLDNQGISYEGKGIKPDILLYPKDQQKTYATIMDELEKNGDQAIEWVLTKEPK